METLETKVNELIDASKYDEAVELIRKEMDITMKCEFIKNGLHFADDKETRDIYKITLIHNKRQYSFKFGQSIKNSGAGKRKSPTLYDVIGCIQKYDVGSFADFCSEFGYDEDSKKAEKIYNAVCDEYMNVSRLFNDSEIEILSLIS